MAPRTRSRTGVTCVSRTPGWRGWGGSVLIFHTTVPRGLGCRPSSAPLGPVLIQQTRRLGEPRFLKHGSPHASVACPRSAARPPAGRSPASFSTVNRDRLARESAVLPVRPASCSGVCDTVEVVRTWTLKSKPL